MLKNLQINIKQPLFYSSHRKFRFRSAFALYFSLVLLGMIPGMRAEAGEYASGAVLHSLAYSVITFLLFTGMSMQSLRKALECFILVAVMGALDEYIQSFFPYRNGSVNDWVVDITASFCMLAFLLPVWPFFQKSLQRQFLS